MQGHSTERILPPSGEHPGDGGGSRGESAPRRRARTWGKRAQRSRPLAAALGQAGLHWLQLLPLRVARAAGGFSGGACAFLPTKLSRVTSINLRLCFPEWTATQRRRLARRSLTETGRMTLELGAMWGWSRERLLPLVRQVEGEELVRDVLARGRGVILLAPHLGAWELVGLYLSSKYPITSLYRPPHMGEMEEFYKRARERFGAQLVPAGAGGVRALHRALQRGEIAGILPDQDAGKGSGIFVPFFGVLANTTVLPSRLAQRTGAAVVLAYAERLADGRGFHLHFRRGSDAILEQDLARSASALNADVERCVRELPQQYLWSYKRFRIRPPGGADLYGRTRAREGDAPVPGP